MTKTENTILAEKLEALHLLYEQDELLQAAAQLKANEIKIAEKEKELDRLDKKNSSLLDNLSEKLTTVSVSCKIIGEQDEEIKSLKSQLESIRKQTVSEIRTMMQTMRDRGSHLLPADLDSHFEGMNIKNTFTTTTGTTSQPTDEQLREAGFYMNYTKGTTIENISWMPEAIREIEEYCHKHHIWRFHKEVSEIINRNRKGN